jgi:pyruvate/2-oxoglutarate dehydrogenase complex dihydrolipoamide acyltransferase (E2) component
MHTHRADTERHPYKIVPFSKLPRMLALMYRSVQRSHMIHGLIEVDVTEARRQVRALKAKTGESLSFTAFIISCVARAVAENPSLNVCHKGSRRLAIYDDVDVATTVEREIGGRKQPIVYIVRAANRKDAHAITREIRPAQVEPVATKWEGFQAEAVLAKVPMPLLRGLWALFWRVRGRSPGVQKQYGGTIGLTAVGMFGNGGGWGIPLAYHTLDVTVGGIAEKPGVVDGQVAIRKYLCLTLSFDHDVIDGAPAARFTQRLRELIEGGYGLREGKESEPVAVAQ